MNTAFRAVEAPPECPENELEEFTGGDPCFRLCITLPVCTFPILFMDAIASRRHLVSNKCVKASECPSKYIVMKISS